MKMHNLVNNDLCCGTESGLISVDEALNRIIEHSDELSLETIPLEQSLNRYVAQDIYSEIQLPIFSQSAVDGYAICSDVTLEENSVLEIVGEARAGQNMQLRLAPGEAVRIFTGAKLPENTTTIARQEIVLAGENEICITQSLVPNCDIRHVGEEVNQGKCLVRQHQQLKIGTIGSLAMVGIKKVTVYQIPKIVVVVTGDEVAEQVEDLNSGKIFDANTPLIKAWCQEQKYEVDTVHIFDDRAQMKKLFDSLRHKYDVIITTGGVSVGDYDFVRPVALNLGFKQIFWKVKQKPGKPLFFAVLHQEMQKKCYLIGLPGNPGAVYMGLQIYVSTLIKVLQGQKSQPRWCSGIIESDLRADARERFLRMVARYENGQLFFSKLPHQQSHMLSNLIHANCLVRIPENQIIQTGQILKGLLI